MTRKSVSHDGRLRRNRLGLLLLLAAKAPAGAGIRASTSSIAAELGVSQQTASRWLSELAADGYAERKFNFVRLSQKCRPFLQSVSAAVSHSLSGASRMVLRGRLVKGLGEGGYYLRQRGYSRQFSAILHYVPFAGTLNIVLSDARSMDAKRALSQMDGTRVSGFMREGRSFGGARLFPAELHARGRKIPCAVVIPDKTHHGEAIVEIIARENLRKALGLKEGAGLELWLPPA